MQKRGVKFENQAEKIYKFGKFYQNIDNVLKILNEKNLKKCNKISINLKRKYRKNLRKLWKIFGYHGSKFLIVYKVKSTRILLKTLIKF